jgi:hydrogenase expression/formation protein HypE
MIAIVPVKYSQKVLRAARRNKYGRNATIVGEVKAEHRIRVPMKTVLGAFRIVDMLAGDPLPRIC